MALVHFGLSHELNTGRLGFNLSAPKILMNNYSSAKQEGKDIECGLGFIDFDGEVRDFNITTNNIFEIVGGFVRWCCNRNYGA